MTFTKSPSPAPTAKKLVIDCRGIQGLAAESVVAWVLTFPEPNNVHVVLPSSIAGFRQLQWTLMGMGCGVTRISKCLPPALA